MIFQLLFTIFYSFLSLLTFWLPDGSQLPFGTDAAVVQAIGWINWLRTYLWPIDVILTVFLYYVLFRLGMMLVRAIAGHRAPHVS